MEKKLIALLLVKGMATFGGVQYWLATPKPGITRADLADAGMNTACSPIETSCQGRDLCQNTLPDGGLSRRYLTVKTLARQCLGDGGTPNAIITRWPRQGADDCFEPLAQCTINGPSFDDGGNPSVSVDQDICACRARGQACRYQETDGGTPLMNFALTYPAPFAGAGCSRKSCIEADGEQGQSMPEECK